MTPVEVVTGSRLHFGLICGPPGADWHYGGIGLMVDAPGWRIKAAHCNADRDEVRGSSEFSDRIERLMKSYRERVNAIGSVRIEAIRESEFHTGLGCGTQLTLATASALMVLSGMGRPASIADVAAKLGRSRRSAIGTFGFDCGGFIVDAGQTSTEATGPQHRLLFPEDWRLVMITPQAAQGLSGDTEESFFGAERFLDETVVARLAGLIQQQITPAVTQADFPAFSAALAEYGQLVGEYYAAAQGGIFSSPLIRRLVASGHVPRGHALVQSSWGPSVAMPVSSQIRAEEVTAALESVDAQLSVHIARPLNSGATVRSADPEVHRVFG